MPTVPSKFTCDGTFDGATNTKPDAVIYPVTGGGGARLHSTNLNNLPELWQRDRTTWGPFTVRHISDRHSFTVVRVSPSTLFIRQVAVDWIGLRPAERHEPAVTRERTEAALAGGAAGARRLTV